MAKIETRMHGQFAEGSAPFERGTLERDGGKFHVLNNGKAYAGNVKLRGVMRLRGNPNRAGELLMLGDHRRGVILGAWTGTRIEGNKVLADGLRWTSPEVEPQVTRYKGLVDDELLWSVSIGFFGRWYYVDELPDSDPDKDCGATWIIEGTEENPIDIFEGSLVTVGADEEASITYAFAAGEPPAAEPPTTLELEPEDERVVEGISGALLLAHLTGEHGMSADAAEDRVREMLAGETAAPDEDGDGDDEGDETEMGAEGGSQLSADESDALESEEPPGEGAEPPPAEAEARPPLTLLQLVERDRSPPPAPTVFDFFGRRSA